MDISTLIYTLLYPNISLHNWFVSWSTAENFHGLQRLGFLGINSFIYTLVYFNIGLHNWIHWPSFSRRKLRTINTYIYTFFIWILIWKNYEMFRLMAAWNKIIVETHLTMRVNFSKLYATFFSNCRKIIGIADLKISFVCAMG